MTHTDLDVDAREEIADTLDDLAHDMENDVGYLLALVGGALEDDENFDTDHERALWAVAQWCQEVNVRPDLSEYETGECVPPGGQEAEHPRYPEDRDDWIEDDNGDEVPRRSEPADFGGGESTGVQDL